MSGSENKDAAGSSSSFLLALKQTLAFVFDLLPALVYCKDTSGIIVCVNRLLAETFGVSKTDLEGHAAQSVFPDMPDHFLWHDPEIFRSGRMKPDMLIICPTPDGARHLRAWKIPLHDPGGRLIGMMGFAVDETRHVRAREALRQSEARYRNFFSTSRDCVYITSMDGATKEFNDAGMEMFGYTREEIVKISVADLYANPEDRKQVIEILKSSGAVDRYPLKLQKKDGTVFPAQLTATVIRDDAGEVIGFQGSIHDVSPLERAEQARRALEIRLQQGIKMEAVAALAGGIAHDFNNLLFGIMGNVELAMRSVHDDPLRQLERAYQTCNEAKELVGRFIAFSKNMPNAAYTNDILSVIRDVMRVRTDLNPHYIYELRTSGKIPPVPHVYGDIFRMLDNLMTNAEHAMPVGGPITVSVAPTMVEASPAKKGLGIPPGAYVNITVADAGPGIPDSYLEKVFDPYFSTRQQVTEKGRGLGLTIVYAIVKRHKGDIAIYSSDQGTRVAVYLPALDPEGS